MRKLLLLIVLLIFSGNVLAQFYGDPADPPTGPRDPWFPLAPCWGCDFSGADYNFSDNVMNALYNGTSGDGIRTVTLYEVTDSVWRTVSFYRASGHPPTQGGVDFAFGSGNSSNNSMNRYYSSTPCMYHVECSLLDSPTGDPNQTWK